MVKLRHSIVVRLMAVITVVILVLCTVLFSIQNNQQKKMFLDFFEQRINLVVDLQIQDLRVAIRQALLTLEDEKNAGMKFSENMNFAQIRKKLNVLLKEDMKGMYVLSAKPSSKSTEEAPLYTMIQGNDTLDLQGFVAGSDYPMDHGKLKAVQALKSKAASSTDAYHMNDENLLTTFVPINNEQGQMIAIMGVDFDYSLINKKVTDLLLEAISIGASVEFVFLILVVTYIRFQLKPLSKVQQVAESAANGDLTVRLNVKGNNEFSKISHVINQMIDNLNLILKEVQVASGGVSRATVELARGAEETAQSAAEVSASMQQVASGAQMQLQSAEETKQAMTEIAIGVAQISETSTRVLDRMTESAVKAESGRMVVKETVSQMERIQEASDTTYESLQRLSSEVVQITEAVRFIQSIAKQTEMLALNASIEAARAGEQGKGFQVVASEVRKLADHSKQSLNHIMNLIDNVYAYKASTENAALLQRDSVEHGLKIVHAADDAFMQINDAVLEISEQVREGAAVSQQMNAASEEVTASLEQLSVIASQSQASSERVAATTEEQSAMTEQIRSSVDQLQALSNQLKSHIDRFKLK